VEKGVQDGGHYRLQVDLMKHGALVHGSKKLCKLWHKYLVSYTMDHFLS
jgi:hypothetical protein